MSQTFEESPLSDSKMDISISSVIESDSGTVDVTTSIISSEGNKLNIKNSLNEDVKINSTDIITGSMDNTEQCSGNSSPDQIWKLDNQRLLDNESSRVLHLEQCNKSQTNHRHDHQQPQHQNVNMLRSELTIANSHPLMSPPGTDSDSENGHRHVFSYPDVIPESEPLRIAAASTGNSSPQLNRLGNNKLMNHNVDVTLVCPSNQRRKISVLREPSPDLISSGSEQDLSQYQATVEPNYQSVALISNNLQRSFNKTPSPKPLSRRKIPVPAELLSDDMSSLDSISNHSFDDDLDHNLASLSPSSSLMDGINDKDEDFADLETPTNMPPDPIPQYTAEDERRDSRNWQKITLPDGKTREIDMKVIEPYKRVLSHGGYLKAGGHNAVVLFCACHLPDRSRTDYHYVMDNLFLYVVKTLEQLVTEDYVLVYLHGGSSRRNVPPFPWLKKCYQLLDRRLRKSLKNLYLVHPTFWLKSVVWMSRPFVSSKFWRKLIYVRSLEELYSLVPVEKASIPDKVKNYDSKYT